MTLSTTPLFVNKLQDLTIPQSQIEQFMEMLNAINYLTYMILNGENLKNTKP